MKGSLFTLKNMTITAIVVLMLLVFVSRLSPDVIEGQEDATCLASVEWNSRINVLGKSFFSLKCERHELEIDQNDVDRDIALEKIKQRIGVCWNNMLQGNNKVFNQNFGLKGSNPCLLCGQINFDKIREGSLSGEDLKIKLMVGEDPTLWTQIYGGYLGKSPVMTFGESSWEDSDIYTDRSYQMIYHLYNPGLTRDKLPLDSKYVDAVLGGKDPKPIIMIISSEDARFLECDYYYN